MVTAPRSRALRDWAIAAVLASLFSFTGLANHPLRANDEPRVAGIAWEMQHSGSWWVPRLAGEPFLEHPPLFYALLAACIDRFGASEGVARLPGAAASALAMLLVFSLARRVADPSAGLPALFALVAIAGFFRFSHRALVDPLLVLFVLSGHYAYVRAVWGGARDAPDCGWAARVAPGWLWAVYAAAALAFWVKGWVGIAAIAGPLAIDALLHRRWRVLTSPAHFAGLPLLGAACAAWPLVLYRTEGEAAVRTFLLDNGWYRFAPPGAGAGVYLGGHREPFWYYLRALPGHVGVVALLLPATAVWLRRAAAPPGWRVPALRFLAWILPVGALLLSIPGTKRGLYLLPFEPPLAVAVGAWIAAAARADAHRSRAETATIAACARAARALVSPFAKLLGVDSAALREDGAHAAAGPCRAPWRIAAVAFAAAVAWNVAVAPFVRAGRDLGPMTRAVAARVGDGPLLGVHLEEGVRGALAFYTGRIPIHVATPEGLAGRIAGSGARFVLAPAALGDAIFAEVGGHARPAHTWTASESDYALYELRPELRAELVPPPAPGSVLE